MDADTRKKLWSLISKYGTTSHMEGQKAADYCAVRSQAALNAHTKARIDHDEALEDLCRFLATL